MFVPRDRRKEILEEKRRYVLEMEKQLSLEQFAWQPVAPEASVFVHCLKRLRELGSSC